MKFGEKIERSISVAGGEPKKEISYPSVRITKNNPAYKSLSSLKTGTKVTFEVTFNVAATGDSKRSDDYGTFVELELVSAKKPRSDNPDNEMSI
jgi:hypothetical protein